MKIALLDPNHLVYTTQSPSEIPLGGAESAACFLALELAAQGHEIYLYNRTPVDWVYGQVQGRSVTVLNREYLEREAFDLLIELSGPKILLSLAPQLRELTKRPLSILWVHRPRSDWDLSNADWTHLQMVYDRCVFVSYQQERSFVRRFDLNPDWHRVIENGINPLFEELFANQKELKQSKRFEDSALRLIYAASPHKGLELLPFVYAPFQKTYPQSQLRVYSSAKDLYQDTDRDAKFEAVWPRLDALDVCHQGALASPEYAQALKSSHILLHPGYLESDTCSLTLLEAMAAGCLVICSNKAALPETASEFGMIASYNNADELQKNFLRLMQKAAQAILNGQEDYLNFCWRQRRYICSRYNWKRAASCWQQVLTELSNPSELSLSRELN